MTTINERENAINLLLFRERALIRTSRAVLGRIDERLLAKVAIRFSKATHPSVSSFHTAACYVMLNMNYSAKQIARFSSLLISELLSEKITSRTAIFNPSTDESLPTFEPSEQSVKLTKSSSLPHLGVETRPADKDAIPIPRLTKDYAAMVKKTKESNGRNPSSSGNPKDLEAKSVNSTASKIAGRDTQELGEFILVSQKSKSKAKRKLSVATSVGSSSAPSRKRVSDDQASPPNPQPRAEKTDDEPVATPGPSATPPAAAASGHKPNNLLYEKLFPTQADVHVLTYAADALTRIAFNFSAMPTKDQRVLARALSTTPGDLRAVIENVTAYGTHYKTEDGAIRSISKVRNLATALERDMELRVGEDYTILPQPEAHF